MSGMGDRRALFRGLLVACQAATIVVTWPLWEARSTPTLLSPFALPVPFGGLLLLTLALSLVRPRAGVVVHAVVLGVAILLDETRFQPSVLSMALLLAASAAPDRTWLGRAHLGAQWAWAGLAKLVSPAFAGVVAPAIARGLPEALPHRELAGTLGAVLELSLGLLVLHAPAHRVVAVGGAALHLVILAGLVSADVNPGARAWNLALAAASLAFFGMPTESAVSPRARVVVVALALSPALYYVGLLHPSLAHQLYAGTMPTTLTCDPSGCRSDRELRESLATFGVPIPGRPGLLRAAFLARCVAGERWLVRTRDPGAHYGEIVGEARCDALESSDEAVTGTFSGLNGLALSSYPGSTLPRAGVDWERP